jgi:hypothetical protein
VAKAGLHRLERLLQPDTGMRVMSFVLLTSLAAAGCGDSSVTDGPDASLPEPVPALGAGQSLDGVAGDFLGTAVATDGNIVAASTVGGVAVFTKTDGAWSQSVKLIAAAGEQRVDLLDVGDGLVLTEAIRADARSLVIYAEQEAGWARIGTIDVGVREFSWASISEDWIVAAPVLDPSLPEQLWVYERSEDVWTRGITFTHSGDFYPSAFAHWGNQIAIVLHTRSTEDPASEVRVFRYADEWRESARFDISESAFGNSIALRDDLMAVGRVTEAGGAVQIFQRAPGDIWSETTEQLVDDFRSDVTIATDIVITAQHYSDENRSPRAFALSPGADAAWVELDDSVFSASAEWTAYGHVTAAAGDVVVIGAPGTTADSPGAIYIHDVLR